MLSFGQFLMEMPMRIGSWAKERHQLQPDEYNYKPDGKPLSTTKTLHQVHRVDHRDGSTSYHAYNPQTNKSDMVVDGIQSRNSFHIDTLAGRDGSTIKAHEFYHHLIHKHNIELVSSDVHSTGGEKVWRSLAGHPTIDMSAERSGGRPATFHKNWERNYTHDQWNVKFRAKKKIYESTLVEMPTLHKLYSPENTRIKGEQEKGEHISTTSSGHHIYKAKNPMGGFGVTYSAYNPNSKQTESRVTGTQIGSSFHVHTLAGREGSSIKADDFYHHLVHNHNLKLKSSSTQSIGGSKVWHKLSQKSDTQMDHIAGWGRKTKLHTGDQWHKNYQSHPNSIFTARKK
jgi:hypothetical protein